MSDAAQVSAQLRAFLAEEVFLDRTPETIGEDDDLVEMGMDSLAILRLMLFIEETFGVDLSDEGLMDEGLSTVKAIAERIAADSG